ncbi:hypothetical protein NECID01_1378 [Nematocida sp. AWRm77]|nr:hypothetical protein NECID01_1378 [Nematocida sp. AWRm77]
MLHKKNNSKHNSKHNSNPNYKHVSVPSKKENTLSRRCKAFIQEVCSMPARRVKHFPLEFFLLPLLDAALERPLKERILSPSRKRVRSTCPAQSKHTPGIEAFQKAWPRCFAQSAVRRPSLSSLRARGRAGRSTDVSGIERVLKQKLALECKSHGSTSLRLPKETHSGAEHSECRTDTYTPELSSLEEVPSIQKTWLALSSHKERLHLFRVGITKFM